MILFASNYSHMLSRKPVLTPIELHAPDLTVLTNTLRARRREELQYLMQANFDGYAVPNLHSHSYFHPNPPACPSPCYFQ